MQLVFNPSQTDSVVYSDDGLMVAPGEWAYLDDDAHPKVRQFLNSRKLIEVEVPDQVPSDVAPGAAAALKEAVADKQKDIPQDAPEVAEKDDPEAEKEPVRNTGRRKTTQTKKEA